MSFPGRSPRLAPRTAYSSRIDLSPPDPPDPPYPLVPPSHPDPPGTGLRVGFLILLVLFTFTVSALADTPATANDIKCVDEVSSSTWQWISAAVVLMCMALLL